MATDPPTGFGASFERSQAALDVGGVPNVDDPAMVDTRLPHAVGGVGSAETYGLAGVGEASHHKHSTHPARFGAHAVGLHGHPQQGGSEQAERTTAGAAFFEGQKQCGCAKDGKCTCQGTCKCDNCSASHTEEQLRGKEQPAHPRPAVTGI